MSLPKVTVEETEPLFGRLARVSNANVPFQITGNGVTSSLGVTITSGDGDTKIFDSLNVGDSQRVE